jgi:tetratricopeptide (TPR) repeat protein
MQAEKQALIRGNAKDTNKLKIELQDLTLQLAQYSQENASLKQENLKLKAQAGLSNQQQEAAAALQRRLESAKKTAEQLETDVADFKQITAQLDLKVKNPGSEVQNLESSGATEGSTLANVGNKNEREQAGEELSEAEKKEKAADFQKLGTACIQENKYDSAIDAYLQSLKFYPGNARVHYNLGLLYKHAKDDNQKAVYHFQQYLLLNPGAEDKKEVAYMITMLSS